MKRKEVEPGCHSWLVCRAAESFLNRCFSDTVFVTLFRTAVERAVIMIIIIMNIYHVLINALSAHMIHINLNIIFYTHVEHSPNKTIYIKYYFL